MVGAFGGIHGLLAAVLVAASVPNLAVALAFVLAMTAAGFLVGRFFGNEERLFNGPGARPAATDEVRRHAKEVVAALAEGGTSDVVFKLLRQVNHVAIVEELFAGAPLDTLLGLVGDLPAQPKERRPHGDQLLRLLSRIAIHADDAMRMRILGAMVKIVPRYRHAVPFLVEICKRVPDAWNDLQPSLEGAASHDPAIARFLVDSAGPKEPFIRQSTELYMTSMVRFRRLCEDRAAGMSGAVDAELSAVIDREFRFLKSAGTVSRRFVWLPAQAHRAHPLVTDEHVDLLLREAPTGLGDVHALLGQLALSWALKGEHGLRVKRIVSALEEAARQHPTAGDALLVIFQGLRAEDVSTARPEREEMRRRAYFALLSASDHNFEVIRLLGTHGIPRDLYKGALDAF